MKKLMLMAIMAVLLVAARAAEGLPVFNATLSTGKEHRFVLVSATGKPSSFLRIGDAFEGYTLKSFDAQAGALVVERDGKTTTLNLAADAAVGNAPAITPATVADATAVLDAMNFEEMLDKTLVGIRKQQVDAMQQMTRQMVPPNADPETREAVAEFQKKIMEEMMGGLSGADLKADVAKIYSETFTREELQQLGAFYQSPTGVMLNEKQPVLTEKMNGVMTQRMMAAMPRVQQMMREFGGQMQARKQAAAAAAAAGGVSAPAPTPAPAPQPGK